MPPLSTADLVMLIFLFVLSYAVGMGVMVGAFAYWDGREDRALRRSGDRR